MNHFLAAPLLVACLLHPSDVFVDGTAQNCATATGTATDPVCTVGDALALAIPGDTVHVAPGTYVENIAIGTDLTLIGTGGQALTILNGAPSSTEAVVSIASTAAVTMGGFTIRGGRSTSGAGGILANGDLTLLNSTVTNNTTTNGSGGGIGSVIRGAHVVIDRCTISNNVADRRAGGVGIFAGSLIISNSTINANSVQSPFYPGGIWIGSRPPLPLTQGAGSFLKITNSTISGNTSNAFQCSPDAATQIYFNVKPGGLIENVTSTGVSGHTNVGSGVGTANMPIRNSIFTGSGHCRGVYAFASVLTQSIIEGGTNAGFYGPPIDPMLGPLQDNGGPTFTMAPLPGSPALDSGTPDSYSGFDQRGFARPLRAGLDIGAVEHQGIFGLAEPHIFADLCNGDGGSGTGCTVCPCGNDAPPGTEGGCINDWGRSARLLPLGSTSITLPQESSADLTFYVRDATPFTARLLISGDALAPDNPANPCHGLGSGVRSSVFNGLRCAVRNTRRHGLRAPPVSGQGGLPQAWGGRYPPLAGLAHHRMGMSPGQVRYFQVIYRDNPFGPCMNGINTTQAVRVRFVP